MTPQTTQQRIARWMGWTPHGDDYWLIPAELDTSPEPGLQSGEPRRLPDLTTFAGVAEWCALIRTEFKRRGCWGSIYFWEDGRCELTVYIDSDQLAATDGATELAALTAAVLAILESEK